MNLKYDVKNDFDKVNLRLDSAEKQINLISSRINKPIKERVLEIFSESVIKIIGSITGIAIFVIGVTSFGGSVAELIKTFISSIF